MVTTRERQYSFGGAACPRAAGEPVWDYPDRAVELGLKVRVRPPGKVSASLVKASGASSECLRVDFETPPAARFAAPPGVLELTLDYGKALQGPGARSEVRFEAVEYSTVYSVYVPVNLGEVGTEGPRLLVSARMPPFNGHVVLPVRRGP